MQSERPQKSFPQERPYPLEILFGKVLTPFEQFLRRATAGGIVLVGVTVLTLILSNSALHDAYHHFWHQHFSLHFGAWSLDHDLQDWVNDALMAVFFFVVGLELKRELLVGELAKISDAILPIVAAASGMLVPALLYSLLNASGPAHAGWGIPMATDIAFAIGILVLLAWRVPRNLIIFLTALAIADDLGAVLVIAIFYTSHIDGWALAVSGGIFLVLLLLNQGGIRRPLPYLLLGTLLWYFLLVSGVHASVAGILLAMTLPARGKVSPTQLRDTLHEQEENLGRLLREEETFDPLINPKLSRLAEELRQQSREMISPQQRLEHNIGPWVTFGVLPIFALANAGVDFSQVSGEMLWSTVTLGIVLGLVLGKFVGISLVSWLAVRLRIAKLPQGVAWRHLLGAAWLAGIGFTMSLFISQLAFTQTELREEAKVGILAASLLAGIIGLLWLWVASTRRENASG
ncbi:Na+/H+ antiporter NhaA [Acidithiobacillus sp. CV18-2]|uniref:Na(+)/H(+) antiporter NhaA n=1 Tax=Igneacidithiobacillus copahuensis TaxID=2724909 RepID=A0AAE2YRI3_9PROT|nr:Na+/H+ antiporter NhaA [Igneacidithiobacillus copahuensis]MBU2753405.1 Na+/H+ antiporter NhaA [Acidithiobacillus sp. CV18-3]MBU2756435.1 Na+/H+ antiporter NhaA [Acidithiobacillus sp. BN09-2]MBU2776222.1 Na+/H+ antiporter NhaA [Acidithiobacillus sp. CV18-2]MBU2795650.1 Na+/H+ antiporter NhaA [Acidithiobacillus sp. VAN18-2]MBU2798350.1 Na+/H+ antiporter NhaA [Acidithiobacillus sp. VAN18-4]UTV81721.1 Na+/H+ antiporter NhaA [Acidithiobacillus sp. YTS05]